MIFLYVITVISTLVALLSCGAYIFMRVYRDDNDEFLNIIQWMFLLSFGVFAMADFYLYKLINLIS